MNNSANNQQTIQKSIHKTAIVSSFSSVIILNVYGLNSLINRHSVAEWIESLYATIQYLQEIHFRYKDTYRIKSKGWKKILHMNSNQKNAGVTILISYKINFKSKTVKRDKGHDIMIKGSIQEDITIINIYAPNIRAPK